MALAGERSVSDARSNAKLGGTDEEDDDEDEDDDDEDDDAMLRRATPECDVVRYTLLAVGKEGIEAEADEEDEDDDEEAEEDDGVSGTGGARECKPYVLRGPAPDEVEAEAGVIDASSADDVVIQPSEADGGGNGLTVIDEDAWAEAGEAGSRCPDPTAANGS